MELKENFINKRWKSRLKFLLTESFLESRTLVVLLS